MELMETPAVSAAALIPAPSREVYAILADYRAGHPSILPMPPFAALDVEAGGVGEGTLIRVRLRLLGRETVYRAFVKEPEPGRVLTETNENGYVTRFLVEPAGPDASRVTIETRTPRRPPGIGALERWMLRRMLLDVYRRELELLSKVAGAIRG
jgi:hypothetical protein